MSKPYWYFGGELLKQRANLDDLAGRFLIVVGELQPKPRQSSDRHLFFGMSFGNGEDQADDEFVLISCQPRRPGLCIDVALPFVVVDDLSDRFLLDLRKVVVQVVSHEFAAAMLGIHDIDEAVGNRRRDLVRADRTYKPTEEDCKREGVCFRCGGKLVERSSRGKWKSVCPDCETPKKSGVSIVVR